MKDFEERFRYAYACNVTVQDGNEIKQIFELMKGCESYLEVGTAEGGSLYILANAFPKTATIVCIDKERSSVGVLRKTKLKKLAEEGYEVREIIANSHDIEAIKTSKSLYDCVLIDAGHTYEDVIADAVAYGSMAKKYIFFHDITLPEVRKAFDWFVKHNSFKRVFTIIQSEKFGYGVVEI